MLLQAFEPPELVIEFRAGCWIAIREVQTPDDQSADVRFDVTGVRIIRVARKDPRSFDRFVSFRENRHTVPTFLAVPDSVISGRVYLRRGEALFWCLELLKTNDVRRRFREPLQQR